MKTIIDNIKRLTETLKDNKSIVLALVAITSIIIIIFLGRIEPSQKETPDSPGVYKVKPDSKYNTWNGVIPGYTGFSEVREENLFGEFIEKKIVNGADLYLYKNSETGTRRNQIAVDAYGTIVYMRIPTPYKNAQPFEEYKNSLGLGDPDIVKYDAAATDDGYVLSNVYLNEGIILNVAETLQLVYSEVYFKPMSKDEFMRFWGKNLIDEYVYPGDSIPQQYR